MPIAGTARNRIWLAHRERLKQRSDFSFFFFFFYGFVFENLLVRLKRVILAYPFFLGKQPAMHVTKTSHLMA